MFYLDFCHDVFVSFDSGDKDVLSLAHALAGPAQSCLQTNLFEVVAQAAVKEWQNWSRPMLCKIVILDRFIVRVDILLNCDNDGSHFVESLKYKW